MSAPAETGGTFDPSIVLNVKLTPYARLLYVVLVALSDEHRECARSQIELAEESGLSRSTVKRAVRELVEAGVVEIYASVNQHGGHAMNVHKLLDDHWSPQNQPHLGRVSQDQPLVPSEPRVQESAGEPLGSEGTKGLGLTEPRGVGSEGTKGPITYKEGIDTSSGTSEVLLSDETSSIREEHSDKPPPEPAPEEPEPMAMINFNDYDLPVQTVSATPPKKARTSKPTEDPDFDKAWDLYGHKTDKVQAQKAWARALKKASAETILAAIPAYVATTTGRGEPEGRGSSWKPRRKNLATWLNNLGWTEEIEPPTTGYQGRAGSDVRTQEGAIERAKVRPICKLMRSGPMPGDLAANRAWYYHWNVQEQRGWTVEQMLETGNTAEDIDWLMDAYANGIDPELYQQFLDDYSIPPHGSDS